MTNVVEPPKTPRRRKWLRRTLKAACAVLVIGTVGLYGATVYLVRKSFTHRVEKFRSLPADLSARATSIALTSSDGVPLRGWWLTPESPRGAVVVLHGMDGLDASCLVPQARFLNDAGWAAFVLDMRAHGRSGGHRIGLALEEPRDVGAVLDWLAAQRSLEGKPIVLLGFSMGGATAIRTAAHRPDVDAVISVSAFASLDPMIGEGATLQLGRLAILALYGAWTTTNSPVHDIPAIGPRPVLVMHGTADTQIPVSHASLLQKAGGPNVTLCLVDGADHLVFTEDGNGTGPADTAYRGPVLEFLSRLTRGARR